MPNYFQPPSRRLPQATAGMAGAFKKMRQQRQQQQAQEKLKRLYQDNTNPDGTMNRQPIMQGLMGINPQMAQKQREQWNKQDKFLAETEMKDLERMEKRSDIGADLLKKSYDEPTYRKYVSFMAEDNPQYAQGLMTTLNNQGFRQDIVDQLQRGQMGMKDKIALMKTEKNALLDKQFLAWREKPEIKDLYKRGSTDREARSELGDLLVSSGFAGAPLSKTWMQLQAKPSMFEEGLKGHLFKGEHRPLPAGSTEDLAATEQSVGQLDDLARAGMNWGNNILAPIINPVRGVNPWDVDAQAMKQHINATKQVIGKGLEGGVLRKEDETKYKAIIPKMGDTPEVLHQKYIQLRKLLVDKYNSQLSGYEKSGFQVGKWSSLSYDLPEFKTEAGKGGAKAPTAADIDQMSEQELRDYLKEQ